MEVVLSLAAIGSFCFVAGIIEVMIGSEIQPTPTLKRNKRDSDCVKRSTLRDRVAWAKPNRL